MRLLRFARVMTALAMLSASSAALAADPPLVPPTVRDRTEVPYPAGGVGDALVELEIVVEKDGSVSRAEVVDGQPPFAEQARLAVLGWHFLPARRGDVPIRVRTRARVAFHREEEADQPAPSAPTAPAPREPTPTPPPSEEVTVRGKRREIGVVSLSASDVREMPGALGDPFRAIEALPGVTPMVSGLPYFFIRGAPPNDNGYYLDGIRVPLLYHVAFGPGVIHPELVERVDLYPGAAPARYGGFTGAIIAGQTREPSTIFRGAANIRLVDAGALLESPFADGRGSALVAGRYGYPGPIVGLFSDVKLGYWDYQSRVAWRLGERDTIGIFAFGSHDYLAHPDERTGATIEDVASDFHRVDLRYDHKLSEGRARVATTFGYDSQTHGSTPVSLTNTSGAARAEIEQRLSRTVLFRGGADLQLDVYGFRQKPSDGFEAVVPSGVDPAPTNLRWGGRADVVWRVAPRVELVPGIRTDVFETSRRGPDGSPRKSTRVPAVDPRLSTRVTLASSLAMLSSFGLAHQFPALRVGEIPAAIMSGAGFPYGSSRLQRVAQMSEGIEISLPAEFVMTTTGFLSSWTGLTDLTANCIQIEPPVIAPQPAPPDPNERDRADPPWICPNEKGAHGRAYGIEFLLRRPLSKRLSGFLSYTLSRSTRETRFVQLDGSTAVATVPSDFDRTHALNAVLAYDLGRRWRAGSRFVFYSGAPYSKLSGSVPVPPFNAFRDAPFFRLDVRLEKRWPLGDTGSIAFVLEGQNVTLSKETTSLGSDCVGEMTAEGGTNTCKRAVFGPITIPSIGVEAFF